MAVTRQECRHLYRGRESEKYWNGVHSKIIIRCARRKKDREHWIMVEKGTNRKASLMKKSGLVLLVPVG